MEVLEYEHINRFLSRNKYPKSVSGSKVKKRNFRRKCHAFVLINGILHYQGKSNRNLRVLKATEVDDVLTKLHGEETGGHLGVNKT